MKLNHTCDIFQLTDIYQLTLINYAITKLKYQNEFQLIRNYYISVECALEQEEKLEFIWNLQTIIFPHCIERLKWLRKYLHIFMQSNKVSLKLSTHSAWNGFKYITFSCLKLVPCLHFVLHVLLWLKPDFHGCYIVYWK